MSDDECPVSNDYWPVTALQTHSATEFSCYEVQIIPILYRESVKNDMWKWSNYHGLAHFGFVWFRNTSAYHTPEYHVLTAAIQ